MKSKYKIYSLLFVVLSMFAPANAWAYDKNDGLNKALPKEKISDFEHIEKLPQISFFGDKIKSTLERVLHKNDSTSTTNKKSSKRSNLSAAHGKELNIAKLSVDWDGSADSFYKVQSGDTLGGIAEKFYAPYVSKKNPEEVAFLTLVNELPKKGNRIKVGQTLIVPKVDLFMQYLNNQNDTQFMDELILSYYTIKKGDTLNRIVKNQLGNKALVKNKKILYNGLLKQNTFIKDANKIKAHDSLKIPEPKKIKTLRNERVVKLKTFQRSPAGKLSRIKRKITYDKEKFNPKKYVHTVSTRDTVDKILKKRLKLKWKEALKIRELVLDKNPEIENIHIIYVGQEILLPTHAEVQAHLSQPPPKKH